MGVQGLWDILDRAGRPVKIDSLKGKILAVDVSIWLHQSVKGYRDKDGSPLPNAHLLGVFYRVCKLLNYGVKPIFVFDGGVPILKRQTLNERRNRRLEATDKSELARQKLLTNFIKQHLEKETNQRIPRTLDIESKISEIGKSRNISLISSSPTKPSTSKASSSKRLSGDKEIFDEEYEKFREKLTENFNNFSVFLTDRNLSQEREIESDEDFENYDKAYGRNYAENFSMIESRDFDTLPLETQHEILFEMSESKKMNSWGKMEQMPKDMKDFSSYQMDLLVKRRKLQKKIVSVQAEMGNRHIHLKDFEDLNFDFEEKDVKEEKVAIFGSKDRGAVFLRSKPEESPEKTPGGIEIITIKDQSPKVKESENELETLSEDEQIELAIKMSLEESETIIEEPIKKVSEKESTKEIEIISGSSSQEIQTQNPSEVHKAQAQILADIKAALAEKMKEFETTQMNNSEEEDLQKAIQLSLLENERSQRPRNSEDSEIEFFSSDDSDKEENKSSVVAISEIPDTLNEIKPVESKIQLSEEDDDRDFEEVPIQSEIPPPEPSKPKESTPRNFSEVKELIEKMASKLKSPGIAIKVDEVKASKEADDFFAESTIDDFQMPSTSQESLKLLKQNEMNIDQQEAQVVQLSSSSSENEDEIFPIQPINVPNDEKEEFHFILNQDSIPEPEVNKVKMISTEYLQQQQKLNIENEKLEYTRGAQERSAASISDQMCIEAQELLALFGIPYVVSPMEAEAQCAFLDMACLSEGSITDDSDVWLFGGQRVYKNFFSQGDRQVEFYEYAEIFKVLNLDREKLIVLAMLIGSDYTEGIDGVGPIKAVEILSEFPTESLNTFDILMGFKEWWDSIKEGTIKPENRIREKLARLKLRPGFPSRTVYDAYKEPKVDESLERFKWGSPDLDSLRGYTKNKFGWEQSKCDATVLPVLKSLRCQADETSRQLTLDKFLVSGIPKDLESRGKKRIKSQRFTQAVKKLKMIAQREVNLSSESEDEEITDPNKSVKNLNEIIEKEKPLSIKKNTEKRKKQTEETSSESDAEMEPLPSKPRAHYVNKTKRWYDRLKDKPRGPDDSTSPRRGQKRGSFVQTPQISITPPIIHQRLRAEVKRKEDKKKAIEIFKSTKK